MLASDIIRHLHRFPLQISITHLHKPTSMHSTEDVRTKKLMHKIKTNCALCKRWSFIRTIPFEYEHLCECRMCELRCETINLSIRKYETRKLSALFLWLVWRQHWLSIDAVNQFIRNGNRLNSLYGWLHAYQNCYRSPFPMHPEAN